MKKIIPLPIFLSLFLVLTGCSNTASESNGSENTQAVTNCEQPFAINGGSGQTLVLKAKVIADNVKNIAATSAGNIEVLNCEKGKKVSADTIIAKIVPDYADPSIKNLVNQANMANTQIENTKDIIASTKSNYSTQLGSLNTQKANLINQLSILEKTYATIGEQQGYGVQDIDKQLEALNIQLDTLNTQVSNLNASKTQLLSSKKADLDKLKAGIKNTRTQSRSLVSNILTQIDEIYGITVANQHKNDDFENLLSAKNSGLKNTIEQRWNDANNQLSSFDSLSNDDVSTYLQSIDDMIIIVKESLKDSTAASNFTQTTIDTYYAAFVQYESGVITAKNGLETSVKSIDTVTNSYDTQILGLNTQIDAAENSKKSVSSSINNISSNKLGTYTTSVDMQKNQSQAGIENAKTNIASLDSQIKALKAQEDIQLNQLNNQLTQLQSSLNTININLNPQILYAGTNGVIKDKLLSVGNRAAANANICQILPEKSSLKIQVYSSQDIALPADVTFQLENKLYTTKLSNRLTYQDPTTQNYTYEANSPIQSDGKMVNITDILSEGKIIDTNVSMKEGTNTEILAPLNYIANTINGYTVKVKRLDGSIATNSVILGELDSENVKVKSGLKFGDVICK